MLDTAFGEAAIREAEGEARGVAKGVAKTKKKGIINALITGQMTIELIAQVFEVDVADVLQIKKRKIYNSYINSRSILR